MSRAWSLPLLSALALLVSGPQRETFDTVQLPKLVGLLILAALSLALRSDDRHPQSVRSDRLRLDALDLLALGIAFVALLSGLTAVSPGLSVRALATLSGGLVLWGALRAADTTRWKQSLAVAITFAAVLAIVESAGLVQWSLRGRAPSGLFGQRNALAHVLVLGLPIVWSLSVSALQRRERALWFFASVLLGGALCLTRSRAGWVAAAVCFIAWLALTRRGVALCSALGFAIAAVSPSAAGWSSVHPYRESFAQLFDSSSGSAAGRLAQWRYALSMFEARPFFGIGPGNWPAIAPDGAQGHFINSDWVALLVERGVLGVMVVGAFGVLLLVRGSKLSTLLLLTAATLGVFDAVTQLAPAVLLLAVGCAVPRDSVRAQLPGWLRSGAITAFVLLGALEAASFASRCISSSDFIPFDRLERAVLLDPLDGSTRLTLSEAYVSAQRCADAQPHLVAGKKLLPRDRRFDDLARVCAP